MSVENMQPMILLTPPSFEENERLGLPRSEDNIFGRIIRDPTKPDRPMRERQCAELLCGLLRNLPSFRSLFVRWLTDLHNRHLTGVEALQWAIDTEYPIDGNKRIDLLLQTSDGCEGKSTIVYAVEVKVAAGFHYSSACNSNADDAEQPCAEIIDSNAVQDDMVNQLENYDLWLKPQNAHKAGFVLATHDMTCELPKNLSQKWICITWGQLAQLITEAIQENKLLDSENVLIRNFLGFINDYLRGSIVNKLDFNIIAFLKAYYAYKEDSEATVNQLVAPIEQMFRASAIEFQDVNFQKTLYTKYMRSIIYADLGSEFKLLAGIADDVILIIQSAPRHPLKDAFRKQLQKTLLAKPDSEWTIEDEPDSWNDACITMPLTRLLDVDDQAKVVQEFVQKGLKDLEAININSIIQRLG